MTSAQDNRPPWMQRAWADGDVCSAVGVLVVSNERDGDILATCATEIVAINMAAALNAWARKPEPIDDTRVNEALEKARRP